MPITRDEGNALAELICIVRPTWNTRGVIRKGLAPLVHHPAPLEVIAWAALRAAKDPANLTPAIIPLNGPHWNLADRPETPRLTPEHECKRHPGKWASNCPLCHVDHIRHPEDPDPRPVAGEGTPRDNAIAAAKAAAARAKHALEVTDDDQEDDLVDPRAFARSLAIGNYHHPERAGMDAHARRRAAMHDCRPRGTR